MRELKTIFEWDVNSALHPWEYRREAMRLYDRCVADPLAAGEALRDMAYGLAVGGSLPVFEDAYRLSNGVLNMGEIADKEVARLDEKIDNLVEAELSLGELSDLVERLSDLSDRREALDLITKVKTGLERTSSTIKGARASCQLVSDKSYELTP